MTMTSMATRFTRRSGAVQASGRSRTFWPAPQQHAPQQPTRASLAQVPTQPGRATRTAAALSGPMPSLRGLGVDPRSLTAARPKVRTTVLRCSTPVLRAAQHLLEQAATSQTTLAGVVESDPVLVLRVLHLANQHTHGGYAADTVWQAIKVLSPTALASLVADLLTDASPGAMDGLSQILARGLACEALSGDRIGFTAGVLTALADRLGVPSEIVLEVAGVSREVVTAVRAGTGAWGQALHAVIAYERGDAAGLGRTSLSPVDVYDTYLRGATEAMSTEQAITAH
jgi:EAL and modified HD-GYP domain-containing signal transduction protein